MKGNNIWLAISLYIPRNIVAIFPVDYALKLKVRWEIPVINVLALLIYYPISIMQNFWTYNKGNINCFFLFFLFRFRTHAIGNYAYFYLIYFIDKLLGNYFTCIIYNGICTNKTTLLERKMFMIQYKGNNLSAFLSFSFSVTASLICLALFII